MTLDEAIKHCEEIAMDKTNLAQTLWDSKEKARCEDCAEEHNQLAQWLIELKMLKTEQEPCGDAISRDFQIGDEVRIIGSDPIYDDCDVGWVIRNASERVKTMYVMRNDGSADEENKAEWYKTGRHNAMLAEVIKQLPSVKPQEPQTGHWIEKMDACECPYCHKAWDYYDNDTEDFDYCPKCGAKLSENPTDSKDVIWHDKRNYSEIVVEPQESEEV